MTTIKSSSLKTNLVEVQQKARERTVKTQNIEYDLETLVKKIRKNLIKLDPDYQRRHRWNIETSSRLIESLILNIPIPLIYLSQDVDVDVEVEDEGTRYSVIDGQQRLTAIVEFLSNKFALEGLETLEELNNSYYKDLPSFLIRRLEERTIKCLRIDSTVDSQVKYDIFERLNSGSVKLEAQELRNAVHRGAFNTMLKELAKDENFRVLLGIDIDDPDSSKRVQKMEDVEAVLRFMALGEDKYKLIKKGLKDFLSEEMKRMSSLSNVEYQNLKTRFLKTMAIIRQKFGDTAFAKFKVVDGGLKRASKFNVSVYDALSIAVSSVVNLDSPDIAPETVAAYQALFTDAEFFASIDGSTTDRKKINDRIDLVKAVLNQ